MKSFGRYIFSAILVLSAFAGCQKEVVEPVLLEIDRTNMKMTVGQSQKLNAVLKGAEGEFVWESDKPEIADVDAEGLVVALSAGKANILVTAGGRWKRRAKTRKSARNSIGNWPSGKSATPIAAPSARSSTSFRRSFRSGAAAA